MAGGRAAGGPGATGADGGVAMAVVDCGLVGGAIRGYGHVLAVHVQGGAGIASCVGRGRRVGSGAGVASSLLGRNRCAVYNMIANCIAGCECTWRCGAGA